ncbi:MAG: SH3 domain-containing protein [Spirochaetes bacterium]|nr:SH3 domain-containing protein [Spirochaetota bacterium]
MYKRIVGMLVCAALLLSWACKKEGVTLINTGLRDVPSDRKGAYKDVKDVNRGQIVRIIDEQADGDWLKVRLLDGVTEGWIMKQYVHKGAKRVLEFTAAARLYDQPDVESKVRLIVPTGSKAIMLGMKDGWYYISAGLNVQGWVKKGSVREGADAKIQGSKEIYIPGIGKCMVDTSTSIPDSAGYTFGPGNLFDRDAGTTWQAGNGGVGSWVEIVFPEPVTVKVSMINGFVKVDKKFASYGAGGDLYELNNRVKSMKVEYRDAGDKQQTATINFADGKREMQEAGTYKNAARIRFIIDGIYKGKKWNDVALAEIRLERQ